MSTSPSHPLQTQTPEHAMSYDFTFSVPFGPLLSEERSTTSKNPGYPGETQTPRSHEELRGVCRVEGWLSPGHRPNGDPAASAALVGEGRANTTPFGSGSSVRHLETGPGTISTLESPAASYTEGHLEPGHNSQMKGKGRADPTPSLSYPLTEGQNSALNDDRQLDGMHHEHSQTAFPLVFPSPYRRGGGPGDDGNACIAPTPRQSLTCANDLDGDDDGCAKVDRPDIERTRIEDVAAAHTLGILGHRNRTSITAGEPSGSGPRPPHGADRHCCPADTAARVFGTGISEQDHTPIPTLDDTPITADNTHLLRLALCWAAATRTRAQVCHGRAAFDHYRSLVDLRRREEEHSNIVQQITKFASEDGIVGQLLNSAIILQASIAGERLRAGVASLFCRPMQKMEDGILEAIKAGKVARAGYQDIVRFEQEAQEAVLAARRMGVSAARTLCREKRAVYEATVYYFLLESYARSLGINP